MHLGPTTVRPTPDALLRRATAIRRLLDDADEDDHVLRMRLVAAQDQVRLEAAQQWHERGWRPITDAIVTVAPVRSVLLAPAVAGLVASLLAVRLVGLPGVAALVLAAVGAAPLLVERARRSEADVKVVARVATLTFAAVIGLGRFEVGLLYLPSLLVLAGVAVLGTRRDEPVVAVDPALGDRIG